VKILTDVQRVCEVTSKICPELMKPIDGEYWCTGDVHFVAVLPVTRKYGTQQIDEILRLKVHELSDIYRRNGVQ